MNKELQIVEYLPWETDSKSYTQIKTEGPKHRFALKSLSTWLLW